MDRDSRWDRVERGYDAIVHGVGQHAADRDRRPSRRPTPAARPTSSSRRPSSTASDGGVRDGEPIIHANFRADRARQLTHALADARPSTGSTGRVADRPAGPDATCSS